MGQSAFVFNVTEKEFQTRVLDQSKEVPVVVDFWAPWCGPCRMLAPLLEKLIDERKGEVLLAKVNTDEEQRLAMEFGIQSLPTVVGFKDGRAVLDFMGVLPEESIRQFLNQLGPSDADREAKKARTLEAQNPAEAEKMYRDALARDRNQEEALIGLARLYQTQGKFAEARELLENVGEGKHEAEALELKARMGLQELAASFGDESGLRSRIDKNPGDAQARYELGCRLAVQGKYQEGLDLLLEAGEKDMKLAGTKVREAMVQIFHMVGNQSQLANEYRSRLSTLLY